eukprot:41917-Alexandrium_andersonii.AAC.1
MPRQDVCAQRGGLVGSPAAGLVLGPASPCGLRFPGKMRESGSVPLQAPTSRGAFAPGDPRVEVSARVVHARSST